MDKNRQAKTISVVIVYTNTAQLNEALKYLKMQSCFSSVELILLDNRKKRFLSAANALNYGAKQAQGQVIIFMHQDVYLWDDKFIEKYYGALIDNPNTILGVAGVAKDDRIRYFDFCESKDKIYRGRSTCGKLMQAVTLDECLFAMQKSLWQKLMFDEKTCDNWHFYGADICYNNLLKGGENIILSANICHESKGSAYNKSFRHSLKSMIKKYRKNFNRIETMCVNIKCSMFMYLVYSMVSWVRQFTWRDLK